MPKLTPLGESNAMTESRKRVKYVGYIACFMAGLTLPHSFSAEWRWMAANITLILIGAALTWITLEDSHA